MHFHLFPLMKNFFDLLFMLSFIVSAREEPFSCSCPFLTDWTRTFLPKDGKDTVREERNERRRVFSRQSRFFFLDKMIKVLFPISTLIWRVKNNVSRQRKVQIGEMTVILILYTICSLLVLYFFWNH